MASVSDDILQAGRPADSLITFKGSFSRRAFLDAADQLNQRYQAVVSSGEPLLQINWQLQGSRDGEPWTAQVNQSVSRSYMGFFMPNQLSRFAEQLNIRTSFMEMEGDEQLTELQRDTIEGLFDKQLRAQTDDRGLASPLLDRLETELGYSGLERIDALALLNGLEEPAERGYQSVFAVNQPGMHAPGEEVVLSYEAGTDGQVRISNSQRIEFIQPDGSLFNVDSMSTTVDASWLMEEVDNPREFGFIPAEGSPHVRELHWTVDCRQDEDSFRLEVTQLFWFTL
ncbi:MAG: hypothetical protein R3F46_00715 [bacterium]